MGFSPGGGGERDARQLAAEVGGVALPVFGVMQHRIDVMKDVPLGDGRIVIMRPELLQRPVGDVLATVAAVFGVGVEGDCCGGGAEPTSRKSGETWGTRREDNPEGALDLTRVGIAEAMS